MGRLDGGMYNTYLFGWLLCISKDTNKYTMGILIRKIIYVLDIMETAWC